MASSDNVNCFGSEAFEFFHGCYSVSGNPIIFYGDYGCDITVKSMVDGKTVSQFFVQFGRTYNCYSSRLNIRVDAYMMAPYTLSISSY